MNGRVAAIWHKHSFHFDLGYTSLEAAFCESFQHAEQHLRKTILDDGDFKNFIAIEAECPIFLDSIDDFNWVSVPSLLIDDMYIQKLKSIGFQFSSCGSI